MPGCIRCDKQVAEDYPDDLHEGYKTLSFAQGDSFLPICDDCLEKVKDRGLTVSVI